MQRASRCQLSELVPAQTCEMHTPCCVQTLSARVDHVHARCTAMQLNATLHTVVQPDAAPQEMRMNHHHHLGNWA